jgi:hypothetical protein
MSTTQEGGSLTITAPAPLHDIDTNLQLVATSAEEMGVAQQQMVGWFGGKIEVLKRDLDEAGQELEIAMRNGWKCDALRKQCNVIAGRIRFYDKCLKASEAGYCVIPNMPCDQFAIRVDRQAPKWVEQPSWNTEALDPKPSNLPAGEGRYVGDESFKTTRSETRGEGDKAANVVLWRATDFDEVDFPVSIRKPAVMTQTARAMAMKCFDAVGVIPSRRRRGDPLVLGLVTGPNKKLITFLIAWYVDTREL